MWTLLALGILFGAPAIAIAARRSRQRFRDSGAAFRCRLRIRGHRSAIWPALGRRWSRPLWALWDDDVLVVRRGPGPARTIPLRAQLPVDGVHHLLHEAPRWCGPRPIGVVLKVWDGSWIEVAAATDDRLQVVGPYLAAAISDLPRAPAPRRPS
ncbi:hypothetical protein GCM10020358_70700 [Amorphoplanes nipponensis]|uniref:Uncharacterized protein n=1 Tax=Actinoplanes nipponensis TaxID=135950 RepID=A0A919JB73_9ACTN|nr:hypothetical protein [Actinoplanes nipponensis]GIE47141.1 hypothetical protein Ani05nite_06750 [Actinoplanes nipponensis]